MPMDNGSLALILDFGIINGLNVLVGFTDALFTDCLIQTRGVRLRSHDIRQAPLPTSEHVN